MSERPVFHLFEAFGVELEYMLVDRDTLSVLPVADAVLGIDGGDDNEVRVGELCWSNELVLHVLEFKTCGPAPSLAGLGARFQHGVADATTRLRARNGRLMPTAMHPWMDPHRETVLWPHGNRDIYETFDRIFGCKGHGWSNLQSAHLNLPFHGDDEFGRLHAAIRVLMPILPALAAASPILERRATGLLDNRLDVYRTNCRRIPLVTGHVIPEPVFSHAEYDERILKPMYADIAPFDPDGIVQEEWLNARGAIARFERDTIEIRVLDVQECPQADLAILALIVQVLKALCTERWVSLDALKVWPVAPLERIFLDVVAQGDDAVIRDRDYLATFGLDETPRRAGDLWRALFEELLPQDSSLQNVETPLRLILDEGPLARRILRLVNADITPDRLRTIYARLCDCLDQGQMLRSPAH